MTWCTDSSQQVVPVTLHSTGRRNTIAVKSASPSKQLSRVRVLESQSPKKHEKGKTSCPLVHESRVIKKSLLCNPKLDQILNGNGDGDTWVEELCIHDKTGVKRLLFVSQRTGVITDEPPTGASKVIYADEMSLRHV
jgi:hypothetical protein